MQMALRADRFGRYAGKIGEALLAVIGFAGTHETAGGFQWYGHSRDSNVWKGRGTQLSISIVVCAGASAGRHSEAANAMVNSQK